MCGYSAKTNKYVRLRDWCISTQAERTSTLSCVREPKGNCCERRGGGGALADSSDFGLLGEQSSSNWKILCFGCRWTALQNLSPPALSSAEKSVIVKTHTKNTQTNSNRYILVHAHLVYNHVRITNKWGRVNATEYIRTGQSVNFELTM